MRKYQKSDSVDILSQLIPQYTNSSYLFYLNNLCFGLLISRTAIIFVFYNSLPHYVTQVLTRSMRMIEIGEKFLLTIVRVTKNKQQKTVKLGFKKKL